jgi:hypothetical protein
MNRRNVYRIAGTAAAVCVILTAGAPAYAADPMILAANDLPTIITNITTWIVGLLVGVATLFLTIGGIRYLAAGGDPAEVEKANGSFLRLGRLRPRGPRAHPARHRAGLDRGLTWGTGWQTRSSTVSSNGSPRWSWRR